jgi:hypothetical protein
LLYEILTGSPTFPHDELPFPVMRKLFTGKLPKLPESHGLMMRQLVDHCWQANPDDRPSFEDILQKFEKYPEQIVPGANPSMVDEYIGGIISWESQNATD